MRKVVMIGNSILRKKSKKVLKGWEDDGLFDDMARLMRLHSAYGMAAVQCGELLRIIRVDTSKITGGFKGVMVNPVIVKGEGEVLGYERNISMRGIVGDVYRHEKITVTWQDEKIVRKKRKIHTREFSGLTARVIQHCVDQLDGIFFIDKIFYHSREERRLLEKKIAKMTDFYSKKIKREKWHEGEKRKKLELSLIKDPEPVRETRKILAYLEDSDEYIFEEE
jgi:peptide deformylase